MNHNISLPLAPRAVTHNGHEATFVIENCFPGYGVTLGNSLQRVLLSSLPGAAVIAAKIEGADHEFTALDGVFEDVLTILLNLKKIRFNSSSLEVVRGTLVVKGGKGEVKATAGGFKFPSDVKVINPEWTIATLTSAKTTLKIEVVVESGLGYRTAAENRALHDLEAGMMAIDSIFSPITKVNYRVDNMRVGERTDFNKITLTLATDGSILPEAALNEAGRILMEQFAKVAELAEPAKVATIQAAAPTKKGGKKASRAVSGASAGDEAAKAGFSDLKLSARIINILEEQGVKDVDDLLKLGEAKLGQISGIGDKAVKEIRRKLGRLGLILNK